MEALGEQERTRLAEIYDPSRLRDKKDVDLVKKMFMDCGADKALKQQSDQMLSEAIGTLEGVSGRGDVKTELITLTHQLINREK